MGIQVRECEEQLAKSILELVCREFGERAEQEARGTLGMGGGTVVDVAYPTPLQEVAKKIAAYRAKLEVGESQ